MALGSTRHFPKESQSAVREAAVRHARHIRNTSSCRRESWPKFYDCAPLPNADIDQSSLSATLGARPETEWPAPASSAHNTDETMNNSLLSASSSNLSCDVDIAACDLPVTGTGRSWHHWNAFGSNLSFVEAASDALRSNRTHLSVIHVDALKIRRCLAPWGFNSPSGHQPQSHVGRWFQGISISRNYPCPGLSLHAL